MLERDFHVRIVDRQREQVETVGNAEQDRDLRGNARYQDLFERDKYSITVRSQDGEVESVQKDISGTRNTHGALGLDSCALKVVPKGYRQRFRKDTVISSRIDKGIDHS